MTVKFIGIESIKKKEIGMFALDSKSLLSPFCLRRVRTLFIFSYDV